MSTDEYPRYVAVKLFGSKSSDRAAFKRVKSQIQKDTDIVLRLTNHKEYLVQPIVIQEVAGAVYEDDHGSAFFLPDGLPADSGIKRYSLDLMGLAMDLHEDCSLDRPLAQANALSDPGEFFLQLVGAIRALLACHEEKVMHCDIKPDNLFWTNGPEGPRLKIGDWGASHQLHRPGDAASIGTPEYSAPEVFDGASPRPPRDVYALGVTLLELLLGSNPIQDLARAVSGVDRVTACKNAHQTARPLEYVQLVEHPLQSSLGLQFLINSMMHPDNTQRVDLPQVVDELKRIALTLVSPENAIEDAIEESLQHDLKKSTIESAYPIESGYRLHRGEVPVFFFVDASRSGEVADMGKRLLAIAKHFFPGGVAAMEVYGAHGFVVRAWDSENLVRSRSFAEILKRDYSKSRFTEPQMLICDSALDLSVPEEIEYTTDLELESRLYALQYKAIEKWSDADLRLAKELASKRILLYKSGRKLRSPDVFGKGDKKIVAYAVINCKEVVKEHKRLRAGELRGLLRKQFAAHWLERAVLYTVSPNYPRGLSIDVMQAQFVIGYVARGYANLKEFPRAILESSLDLGETSTWSYVATGEFAYLSDRLADWHQLKPQSKAMTS